MILAVTRYRRRGAVFSWFFLIHLSGKMVYELALVTWSLVARSYRAVCRQACLSIGPLGLEPLCAPLPNQAAQYAEQPLWRPQCSAPSCWPPLKLWNRAGLSCDQSAGARCQMGWMAEIVMQGNMLVWIRWYWQRIFKNLPTGKVKWCCLFAT